jgi:hypothetical protein
LIASSCRARARRRALRWAVWAAVAALLVPTGAALAVPLGSPRGGSPRPAAAQPSIGLPTGATFSARLLWDGHDTANATTPTGAIGTSFATVDYLEYEWHARGGKLGQPIPYNVTTARVAVIYLGLPVFGRAATNPHATPASAGFLNVSWDATADYYLLEGLYRIDAKLIASNGTTVWGSSFYIRAAGPHGFAALPVGLAVLVAIELYTLLALVLRAPRPPPRVPPPPETAAAASPGTDRPGGG